MYSQTVMEHFKNPRNVGTLEDADGVGEVGNPVCGDMMTFYIKVKDNVIDDIKFQTFGCGAAIAVSSMVSEMAKGKTLEEASKITNQMVAEALEGLPKQKLHCSNLGADALQKAIQDYQNKKSGRVSKPESKKCYCPVCDIENPMESEICTGCGKGLPNKHAHGH
ncbi:MAG: Fe-S cluster assembly scaffold protein NifU [Deltaproteobacteria bacterium]|jgi:nitrogen fixation NifU-like protein|nr:Fe-S cluster assembly scaffold protein NifU [Deltaproteobacteria bacterium]MDO9210261.1 Fe-S cluster assembly scaffold protein NifU [Deltaproteobacteria bacterium]